MSQLSRAQALLGSACEVLLDPKSTQAQIVDAANTVARNTTYVCGACKSASQGTRNAVAKKQFLHFAKEVPLLILS